MGTRTLGSTGLLADEITIGTSRLGDGTRAGSREDAAAVSLAHAFLLGPFALLDTSNRYADGRSEEALGAARMALGDAATARVVTKVDCDPHTGVFDRDRVLRSYEESLRRLRLDRIEVLHLHDPYTVDFAAASSAGGAIAGMVELRDSGAVDAIGIAAGPIPLMLEYVRTDVFDVLLTHNRYTLVDRSAAPLLEEARARGMGTFNAAPFGSGILSTGARAGASYGYRAAPSELIEWVARVETVCDEYGVTLPCVALHFSLCSPLVDSTVVGVSSAGRLQELDDMRCAIVPDEAWSAIDALGPAPSPLEDQ